MFTQDLVDLICEALARGDSLRKVCDQEGRPSPQTVLRWLTDDDKPGFAEQYARARDAGYKLLADEILEISDREGGPMDAVARDRLRVDSRKWLLSKMLPKVYGDKLDLTVENRPTVQVLSDDDLARIASRGSAGAADPTPGEDKSPALH